MHKLLASIVVFSLALGASAHADTLRIYHIDVDQGSSTLLVGPTGKTLLVDSGNKGDQVPIGAQLRALGLKVDVFVLTHFHKDHMGSIVKLKAEGRLNSDVRI